MVDSTPEVHPIAGDPDHHLVQMPLVPLGEYVLRGIAVPWRMRESLPHPMLGTKLSHDHQGSDWR